MPSHATPLVVECDAADVQRIDEWFRTRDERCRWNVVDVRAASAEELGPGPGDSSLLDRRYWPRWSSTCARLPRRRGRERSMWAAAAAATRRCCAVGTASTSCVRLDRDAKGLRRWARLCDRHAVRPESRVAVEATLDAGGRPHGRYGVGWGRFTSCTWRGF